MKKNKFLAVIPARYASTRFPGKPLVDLCGKPMIQRVYETVASCFENVVVATDDQRIFDRVIAFGGSAVMTSTHHQSGTDRCNEALQLSAGHFDVVVNIQGDEPFIHPEQLEAIKACFNRDDTEIATLVKPFTIADGIEALMNPNSPKVVLNQQQEALYFSRSVVPFLRNYPPQTWLQHHTFYKHIGLYAYRADLLRQITSLSQSSLELAESLEQLRWLENGYTIKVGITNQESIGIDTPEDLAKAIIHLQSLEKNRI